MIKYIIINDGYKQNGYSFAIQNQKKDVFLLNFVSTLKEQVDCAKVSWSRA